MCGLVFGCVGLCDGLGGEFGGVVGWWMVGFVGDECVVFLFFGFV